MKRLIPIFCFTALSLISFGINAQNQASIKTKNAGTTPPDLQYLFDTYGIEAAEAILLNIVDYEKEHNVFVLYGDKYTNYIESIEKEIANTPNNQEKLVLERKKELAVELTAIETIVTNK